MAVNELHCTQVGTLYHNYVKCTCFISPPPSPSLPLRYMKGTQDRGSILGSVEEIVLTLDDNAMNLQVHMSHTDTIVVM